MHSGTVGKTGLQRIEMNAVLDKAVSLCIIVAVSCPSFAQITADSLWSRWNDINQPDTTRLKALDKMIWDDYLYSQPDSAFYFAQLEYDFASARDLKLYMAFALNIQGISYRLRGDYPKALGYYQKCLGIREEMGDKKRVAGSLNNIGLIYSSQDQYPKALEYYKRSLSIYEEIHDTIGIANISNNIGIVYVNHNEKSRELDYFQKSLETYTQIRDIKGIADCLTNIGNVYQDQDNFPEALDHQLRSLAIYEEIEDKKGIADCLINIGQTNRRKGDFLTAMEYYKSSLKTYREIGDKYGIALSHIGIGTISEKQGNHQKALIECEKGLQLANEIENISTKRDACQCLYNAHKGLGNSVKALEFHEHISGLNDSLRSEETAKQLERMEFQKQILADSLRQEEDKLRVQMENDLRLARESRKRNIALTGGAFFILVAASLYIRMGYIRKSKVVIEKERDRSETLLLNILPAEIARELKEKGRADARNYESVSILFTDFKGFTQTAEKLSARELVEEINLCFEAFDAVCGKYGIEKIKTIGDAYMAAGGLPVPSPDSAKNTVLAALEMQAIIADRKTELDHKGLPAFEMRVGIHTGPVVAGIVGVKKFQYDIWGDTVNTASRLETSGQVGKVNISRATYDLLKDDPEFSFVSRGRIDVKGKGAFEMFFVRRTPVEEFQAADSMI